MKDYLQSLRTQAWRTAGARYNAARRLKRRELFSTVSLALFSALTIAVAFVQRAYSIPQGTPLDNYLAALSVCLGIFILAMSLMEWGAANGTKADALHRNAEDLTAFQLKVAQRLAELKVSEVPDLDGTIEHRPNWNDVNLLREEYGIIKDRCLHNHLPLDDLIFRASQRFANEFARDGDKPSLNFVEAKWAIAKWHFLSVWYFAVFWLIITAALLAVFWIPDAS
jgi:hypothetical protein